MDNDRTQQNQNSLKQLIRTIRLSQGEFSLVLACCSYHNVRTQVIEQFRVQCPIPTRELTLAPETKTLYTTVTQAVQDDYPQALMVRGLETVINLEPLLIATKLIGEEFYRFPFPLVLWVTDEVLQKMIRLAPDFHGRATSIQFTIATESLIDLIDNNIEAVFHQVLKSRENVFLDNLSLGLEPGSPRSIELLSACRELEYRAVRLTPELAAGLEFVLGRTSDNTQVIARDHYERSLKLWRNLGNLERQGHLLFYLGLWWLNYSVQHYADRKTAGHRAQTYFRESIQAFEAADQPEFAAKFINFLCEALHRLEDWNELEIQAKNALRFHQAYPDLFRLARTYGFLAEVELARSARSKAQTLAQKALVGLDIAQEMYLDPSPQDRAFLDWENSFHRGWYLFSLGTAQYRLGQIQQAITTLESARKTTKPYYDPLLYIGILKQLGAAHYQQNNYLEAFKNKRESQVIEGQFGLRTFVGAARLRPRQQIKNPVLPQYSSSGGIAKEILASRRHYDLNELLSRIKRDDHRLIIIHGQSGVGKSSLLQAGLVPALREQPIDTRKLLPVLQRVYSNWAEELGGHLQQALTEVQPNLTGDRPNSIESLIRQLQKNSASNLLTILIFDQFEELFFVCPKSEQRQLFYKFLKQCLDIPYVKVVLALREDYLHFLLECNDRLVSLDIINNNILDQKILYYLGNFESVETRALIRALTVDTAFPLEERLIDQLVEDLSAELGEVRPIELQVVGAQLQAEKITTLAKYRRLPRKQEPNPWTSSSIFLLPFQEFTKGLSSHLSERWCKLSGLKPEADTHVKGLLKPKFVLINRYLEDVIKNCGEENQQVAEVVLYLLTDEQKNRPLKTSIDIERELKVLADYPSTRLETLDLILEIFVKSGVVTMLKQVPSPRYQLVHDYLVNIIRQRQGDKILRDLRQSRRQQEFLQKAITYGALVFGLVMAASAGFAGWQWHNARDQEQQTILAKLNARYQLLEQVEEDQLAAFVTILTAGRELQNQKVDSDLERETLNHLWRAVHFTPERNRLEDHRATVTSISISPDGALIASGSSDTTVKLWNIDGSPYQNPAGQTMTLENNDGVRSVSFSPDQNPQDLAIAAGGKDKTVKLWNLTSPQPIWISPEHGDEVRWVSFSPDGQTIASASADRTVRLWDRQTKSLITTLRGHSDEVYSVSFSPDNQTLASASKDRTIKLWALNGTLLNTLKGHEDGVTSVSFSPDGNTLASASDDGTVKLWGLNRSLFKTIEIKNIKTSKKVAVNSVAFDATGDQLATASSDGQIRMWTKEGQFVLALPGHRGVANQVKFLSNSEQKQAREILVSAGADKTIRLWNLAASLPTVVQPSYTVSGFGATFSPKGDLIASASAIEENNIIRLWNPEKVTEFTQLPGQKEWVNSLAFSQDGQVIASGLEDGTIKLWQRNGKLIKTLTGHQGAITKVQFKPQDKNNPQPELLASASKDGTVKLWTLTGKLLYTMDRHPSAVTELDFSADGTRLVSASNTPNGENLLLVWQLDGTQIASLKSDERFSSISFNPRDKNLIATALADYSIKFWRLEGENLVLVNPASTNLGEHQEVIYKISFSPDGAILASASADGTVKIWDQNGVFLATLHEGTELMEWVSFNSKGELAAIDNVNQIRIWQDTTQFEKQEGIDELLEKACQQIGDYLHYNKTVSEADRSLCPEKK
ncbi:MAG: sugar-binding protein [Oscillatoriales cyanobacterium SM2_3_0]|nr:sugar-binding protein [Oscillatoriales cyanobacterium SM2_3_0]